MLFLTKENEFSGDKQEITIDEVLSYVSKG
jgi:hypothetical protein